MDAVQIAGTAVSYWPLVVLAVSMCFVVLGIAVLRMHPFVVLMRAAILVGLMSAQLPGVPPANALVQAVELPMTEFGAAAGRIAFIILLASIIGHVLGCGSLAGASLPAGSARGVGLLAGFGIRASGFGDLNRPRAEAG